MNFKQIVLLILILFVVGISFFFLFVYFIELKPYDDCNNNNNNNNDKIVVKVFQPEKEASEPIDYTWIPLDDKNQKLLAIGNIHAATDPSVLKQFDLVVIAIPWMPLEPKTYEQLDVETIFVPIMDDDSTDLYEWIPKVVPQVIKKWNQNKPVLIHCWVGMSRSVSLAAASIMIHKKWNFQKTLKHIQSFRTISNPIPHFQNQLDQLSPNILYQNKI
jgi:hypothetical protein